MRNLKIVGYGYTLGDKVIKFGANTRYRTSSPDKYLDLVDSAINDALKKANLTIDKIDIIIGAMATPLQAIPCNAALIHEKVAQGYSMPAHDINSSCTSFLTALDVVSCYFKAGLYQNALIISGDIASCALNPKDPHTYELFSDVATAFVVENTNEDCGIIYSKQSTYSEGAHLTEIPKGGSLSTAFVMNDENYDDYYFTMKGVGVIRLSLLKLKEFFKEIHEETGETLASFQKIIPHQASSALTPILTKLGFSQAQFTDIVKDYGNMVSGSVPFTLCHQLERNAITRGDEITLFGTAAGITINLLKLRY